MSAQDTKPLVVILSNRGPFDFTVGEDGAIEYTRGQGGLVTALGGITGDSRVMWIAAALGEGDDEGFEVALIPLTLEVTTLGTLQVGDRVNLEVDLVARYLERLIRAKNDEETHHE